MEILSVAVPSKVKKCLQACAILVVPPRRPSGIRKAITIKILFEGFNLHPYLQPQICIKFKEFTRRTSQRKTKVREKGFNC